MKVDDLRKIIYEEVQKAIRVELRDMLTEMQAPATPKAASKQVYNYAKREVQQVEPKPFSISDMLQETATVMTREDYHNIMGNTVVQSSEPASTMINESADDMSDLPSFVRNAKAILDASVVKDKERNGI